MDFAVPTDHRIKLKESEKRDKYLVLARELKICPEDLPRAMNDREEWRERVRDIRATSTI